MPQFSIQSNSHANKKQIYILSSFLLLETMNKEN